mmetsp:Transcript_17273/g.41311  ORF Transcript_17273/g.41311 Transcript_17273/m.41311 type:complete len:204 (+) Transcript_17273:510-1121(+)
MVITRVTMAGRIALTHSAILARIAWIVAAVTFRDGVCMTQLVNSRLLSSLDARPTTSSRQLQAADGSSRADLLVRGLARPARVAGALPLLLLFEQGQLRVAHIPTATRLLQYRATLTSSSYGGDTTDAMRVSTDVYRAEPVTADRERNAMIFNRLTRKPTSTGMRSTSVSKHPPKALWSGPSISASRTSLHIHPPPKARFPRT